MFVLVFRKVECEFLAFWTKESLWAAVSTEQRKVKSGKLFLLFGNMRWWYLVYGGEKVINNPFNILYVINDEREQKIIKIY